MGLPCVDRKSTRREAVKMALAYGAEVGGTLENAELVIVVLAVDRVAQSEAGIVEIYIALRRLNQGPEGEEVGHVIELGLLALGDNEDVDGRGVIEAGMKQVEGETVRLP